jgi:hypothetical protein
MRMELELARPGVEHHGHAEPRAEPRGIAPEGEERPAGGAEQEGEQPLAVVQDERAQRSRQREDDVKVWDRQELGQAGIEPPRFPEGLAFRAVAVAARVVRRPRVAAVVADVEVAA